MGPYTTLDTELELSTAQGVIKWGYPYYNAWGNLFNEPPLGFYSEAIFLQVFGVTEANGVALITLFGLACIVMVYKLGKQLYSKTTGIVAAAIFALAPWELILSRAFLIDTQCLLLSMIYLYFGILAVRKNSIKLATVSGVFFALALLTKLFAVFMLIPLLLLYIYQKPKNPKQILSQVAAFSLPTVFSTLLWYQVIAGKELLYLINHNDFVDLNFPEYTPTYAYISNFLMNYGLGVAFFVAVIFSFIIGFLLWKQFSRQTVVSDIVCLVTILFILGLVMYLGVNVNLKAPYVSAVKYIYQSLPFFSLAAAALAIKSGSLLKAAKQSGKIKKIILFSVGLFGLLLLAATVISSMNIANQLATSSYLIFRVQPDIDVGYSFHVDYPLSQSDPLLAVQFLGFMVLLSGLLWVVRHHIGTLLKSKRENTE